MSHEHIYLWQDWTDPSKPWAGMDLPCKPADRLLFNAPTIVTVGDGKKAQFWHHSWLDAEAPKNLAPHLFELVKRKNRTIQQELHNNNWIRLLRGRITTATHLEEFVLLWLRVQSIQLQPRIRDSVVWKWSTDGTYSTQSAYCIQFQRSYRRFRPDLISKAHAENKYKVFTWILIQNKILTADNLQLRNWPHQDHCMLCNGPLETALHLRLLCPPGHRSLAPCAGVGTLRCGLNSALGAAI
jgi:hypothetical protein